jgi:hypothetical protein
VAVSSQNQLGSSSFVLQSFLCKAAVIMGKIPAMFSIAIMCSSTWLMANIAIDIADYRILVIDNWDRNRWDKTNKAITQMSACAIAFALFVYIATALVVSLTTRNLDQKAISIIYGLSLLFSCIVIFSLSYKTPKWLGHYYSAKRKELYRVDGSLKKLLFHLRWTIWRHFGQVYFILTLFYCGVIPATIPVSVLLGVTAGWLVYGSVYTSRTRYNKHTKTVAIVMSVFLAVCSCISFAVGCVYIQQVWGNNSTTSPWKLGTVSFFVAFALEMCIHVWMSWRSARDFAVHADKRSRIEGYSMTYKTIHFTPKLIKEIGESKHSSGIAADEPVCAADLGNDDDSVEEVGDDKSTQSDDEPSKNLAAMLETPKNDLRDEENLNKKADTIETNCSLICTHMCGRGHDTKRPKKSCREKLMAVIRWTVWLSVSMFFMYLTIINMGASQQTKEVMRRLPSTYATLYPPTYNTGEVCAWNDRGENSTIKTFPNPYEAYAANFSVVHCGRCAACSNWNDLRLQWTTRTYLAALAQSCAKKSLFGGIDAVHACNRDVIGFTDDCAMCWTVDELCAKKNCVFIFLQGVIINKLANFNVGPDEITSATCDEAICGPVFVPCVGATRRRMGIISDISRPKYQHCDIADRDWQKVFNYP